MGTGGAQCSSAAHRAAQGTSVMCPPLTFASRRGRRRVRPSRPAGSTRRRRGDCGGDRERNANGPSARTTRWGRGDPNLPGHSAGFMFTHHVNVHGTGPASRVCRLLRRPGCPLSRASSAPPPEDTLHGPWRLACRPAPRSPRQPRERHGALTQHGLAVRHSHSPCTGAGRTWPRLRRVGAPLCGRYTAAGTEPYWLHEKR